MRALKIWGWSSGFFLMILFFCTSALAFRCGTELISVGDTKSAVLQACGEPDNITFYDGGFESRFYSPYSDPVENRIYREKFSSNAYAEIEQWTYNPGSNGFLRFIWFDNDVVKKIQVGGRGY